MLFWTRLLVLVVGVTGVAAQTFRVSFDDTMNASSHVQINATAVWVGTVLPGYRPLPQYANECARSAGRVTLLERYIERFALSCCRDGICPLPSITHIPPLYWSEEVFGWTRDVYATDGGDWRRVRTVRFLREQDTLGVSKTLINVVLSLLLAFAVLPRAVQGLHTLARARPRTVFAVHVTVTAVTTATLAYLLTALHVVDSRTEFVQSGLVFGLVQTVFCPLFVYVPYRDHTVEVGKGTLSAYLGRNTCLTVVSRCKHQTRVFEVSFVIGLSMTTLALAAIAETTQRFFDFDAELVVATCSLHALNVLVFLVAYVTSIHEFRKTFVVVGDALVRPELSSTSGAVAPAASTICVAGPDGKFRARNLDDRAKGAHQKACVHACGNDLLDEEVRQYDVVVLKKVKERLCAWKIGTWHKALAISDEACGVNIQFEKSGGVRCVLRPTAVLDGRLVLVNDPTNAAVFRRGALDRHFTQIGKIVDGDLNCRPPLFLAVFGTLLAVNDEENADGEWIPNVVETLRHASQRCCSTQLHVTAVLLASVVSWSVMTCFSVQGSDPLTRLLYATQSLFVLTLLLSCVVIDTHVAPEERSKATRTMLTIQKTRGGEENEKVRLPGRTGTLHGTHVRRTDREITVTSKSEGNCTFEFAFARPPTVVVFGIGERVAVFSGCPPFTPQLVHVFRQSGTWHLWRGDHAVSVTGEPTGDPNGTPFVRFEWEREVAEPSTLIVHELL